jgi:thymidine phosphorylase
MVAQTDDIAPADRALYGLRDVTGTVPSLPLMVASIMSKKLALGAGTLVLDVKWGRGAFRSNLADAAELAAALRGVAGGMEVAAEALITDMNQPLAPALGTACEVRAAREVLVGDGSEALREVTVRLAREALLLRGWQPADADATLARVLEDGSALEAWERLVEAHGGDPDPDRLPKPDRTIEVAAPRGGWISGVAADDLGWVAVVLGAGRRTRTEEIDRGGGVHVHARIGDRIDAGQVLATLELGVRPVDEAELIRRTEAAFEVSEDPVQGPQLVLGTVDEVEQQLQSS